MNPVHKLVRFLSSWSLAPLLARGALLVAATLVLAAIGKGALSHLDEVAVSPVYAATRPTTAPGSMAMATDAHGPPPDAQGAREIGEAREDAHNHGSATDGPRKDAHGHEAARAPDEATRPCAADGAGPGCSGQHAPGVTADGRVILNTASVADFTRLPGIGKRRAEAIVALRKKLGRFRRVRDLLRVRGIGFKSLKKIAPMVVLDPPES